MAEPRVEIGESADVEMFNPNETPAISETQNGGDATVRPEDGEGNGEAGEEEEGTGAGAGEPSNNEENLPRRESKKDIFIEYVFLWVVLRNF